ncbi:MAG TPA: 3'(2'),5'-bisphosphate nucleotidase CysQ [Pseudolabrys sp.]|nr:3'(2'),5'-bisphosphate nucleotidase CysQ [Pseudolabrys sp.]
MTSNNAAAVAPEITPEAALRLLDGLTAIVARAAAATLVKPGTEVERRIKPDQSPVTAADEASEAVILEGLAELLPGLPVVAEESVGRAPADLAISFAIVDPLDGTKEFIAGRDEFTVNLAIATRGVPVVGLVAAPAQGVLWRGVPGQGAERLTMRWTDGAIEQRTPIHTRRAPGRLTVAVSRSHMDKDSEAWLARFASTERYPCGSSVKFCHIAEGKADLYPRLGPTSEWDIAAGCAVLSAAGGIVTDPDGGPLRFGSGGKFLVPGFIAWGDRALATRA